MISTRKKRVRTQGQIASEKKRDSKFDKIGVRISPEVHERFRAIAEAKGMSVHGLVVKMITEAAEQIRLLPPR